MIKFNDNSIYVGQIKQLLHSFNLPQCPIGEKDFTHDTHYIKGNSLFFYKYDINTKTGKSTRVSSYKENDYIENITKTLEIKNNIYDAYTHEYLGNYLRYLRDYKGLNLMSLYNCFSNTSIVSTRFEVKGSVFDSNSSEYTTFAIPIKYDQKYTIAIDWHGVIELCCGYYSNDNLNEDILPNTYLKMNDARFSHPFVYDKALSVVKNYNKEKEFKLFIKIPTICKSSIVVLEGDYSRDVELLFNNESIVINREDDTYLDATLEYLSRPQLLSMNYQEPYLLADRLIEYLSDNVITHLDPVVNNIARLQKKILAEYKISYDFAGIWEERLRNFIYTYCIDKGISNKFFDLLGYLDKDVEGNDYRGFDIEYIKTEDGIKENNEWLTM